jgi:hypothetical protein
LSVFVLILLFVLAPVLLKSGQVILLFLPPLCAATPLVLGASPILLSRLRFDKRGQGLEVLAAEKAGVVVSCRLTAKVAPVIEAMAISV